MYSDNSITCLSRAEEFRYFLSKAPIKLAVEIGSHKGLSANVLAEYADRVVTIDVKDWGKWNVAEEKLHKVERIIISSEAEERAILDSLNFDFAFIDGDHHAEAVIKDFDMVRKCGRVLFHDYWFIGEENAINRDLGLKDGEGVINCRETKEAIDSLGLNLEIKIPFAYFDINNKN